jgi:hypothetical protein
MLFVSRAGAYRLVISPGSLRWVKDPSGAERQVDNGDFFWCEFKLGGLEPHQQDIAVAEFRRIHGPGAFGAEPIQIDGTINQMDAASEGERTTPRATRSGNAWAFDTDDGRMCRAGRRPPRRA